MLVEKGKIIEYKKTFSALEVKLYSEICEDNNPIHLDKEYASKTIFKKRVVHGVLLISMFSKIFGTQYPGNGSIYTTQNTKFIRPIFVDEEFLVRVTLTDYDKIKNKGTFKTECFNKENELAVTGTALIIFPIK